MIKYILTGLLFIFTNSYSQFTQQWANRLNGSSNRFDIANNLFLDAQSNAYVYSTVSNTDNMTDICAIKYNSEGNIVWQYVYSSPGIDQLQDVYKDGSNNSYITGYTQDSGQIKLLTIKLNPQGDAEWTKILGIATHENLISQSIKIENNNNILTLFNGRNISTSKTDFIIIRYNQSGTVMDTVINEGSSAGDDIGVKMLCFTDGSIFVGINSFDVDGGMDVVVYKLYSNLSVFYSWRLHGTDTLDDGVIDMRLTSDENIVVLMKMANAGSGDDIETIKINSASGTSMWRKTYNGSGNDIDFPYSLTIDNENNSLITGYSRNSNVIGSEDIITLKYDSNGNLLWSKVYNDSTNGIDQGFSICTDVQNNVYIGGTADFGNVRNGYITLKYDESGNLLWKGLYRYITLSEDFIYKIAVNNAQDIFVSGISFSNTTDYDVATIKYAKQTGIYSNYETVSDFKLYSNYPNPFNPSTRIRFYNPVRNFISIKVFDLNGREIALLENKILVSGNYEYEFKPDNLSSGVYLYKVYYGEKFKTGKMIFNK